MPDFGFRGQRLDFSQLSDAIFYLIDFNATHFGFFADVKFALLVDVGFVVPAKSNIHNVRGFGSIEGSQLFGGEIGKLLGRVNLVPVTPNVAVGVDRLHVFELLL